MSAADSRRAGLRTHLIDLAEEAVAARGIAGVHARELAEAAGCATGTIYTVFPDLDALVLEVNLRTLTLFEAALGPRGAAPGTVAAARDELVRLGHAYLDFARAHRPRWRALFQRQPPPGRASPDWYVAEQGRLFQFVEAPLHILCPDLDARARALLARSLFSATHGVVMLGLDEQLMALPAETVREQLRTVIGAMAAGLARQPHRCVPE